MPRKLDIPCCFSALLAEYCAAKVSTTDIASACGVGKATVLKWMDQLGVERHQRGVMIAKKAAGKSRGKGAVRSAESRARMSVAAKARAPTYGQKRSPESKRRMSEAAHARWSTHQRAPRPERKPPMDRAVVIANAKARSACKTMLRRVLLLVGAPKTSRTESMLGYSKTDLRAHIERQFRPGMHWGARDSFHIDHIVPVADFLRRGVTEPGVINALSNLQVLTPRENREKSDKLDWSASRRQALVIDSSGTRPYTA